MGIRIAGRISRRYSPDGSAGRSDVALVSGSACLRHVAQPAEASGNGPDGERTDTRGMAPRTLGRGRVRSGGGAVAIVLAQKEAVFVETLVDVEHDGVVDIDHKGEFLTVGLYRDTALRMEFHDA